MIRWRPRLVAGMAVAAIVATAIIWVTVTRMNEYAPRLESYQVERDARHLLVKMTVGIGDLIVDQRVEEGPTAVTVEIRARRTMSDKPALGIPMQIAVVLKEPLGDRRVLDPTGRVLLKQP